MRTRRSKNDRAKWLLIALGWLAGGAAWWVGRILSRRKSTRHRETALAAPTTLQVPVTALKGGQEGAAQQALQRSARVYDAPPALHPPVQEDSLRFPWLLVSILLLILVGFTVMSLMDSQQARPQVTTVPGGDVEAGRQSIQAWGCGSCHTIPGIPGAYGKVGPRLDQMAEQTYIAGMLPNNPDNLMHWIMNPQEIQPGNAMPNTGVGAETARHMAAYLYSIR